MKKYRYFLIVVVLTFSACSDKLELTPEFSLTPEVAFEVAEEYDQALIGAYNVLNNVGYYGGTYGDLQELMADGLTETDESLRNDSNMTDWNYTPSEGSGNVAGGWSNPYLMIARVNSVIDGIDLVPEQNEGSRNRIKGQALALRALGHFDLLRLYGQSYARNSTALGVPIRITQSLELPTRVTVAAVYDQIFTDLEDALLLFSDVDEDPNDGGGKYRIDATAVNALLARVSLYAGEYEDAEDYATTVINGSVSLATTATFEDVWASDSQDDEVIFSVAIISSAEGRPMAKTLFAPNNRLAWVPAQDVVNLYDEVNDIRFSAYFSSTSNIHLSNGGPNRIGTLIPIKFLGRDGALDGVTDLKIMRMAEMYLIRAEARARLTTNDAGAMADLNFLRANRISGYVNENLVGLALLNAIKDERRKELWLEGHRWTDLRRYNEPVVRGADCASPMEQCALEANNFRKVWPIPTTEIVVSSLEQNDNY